MHLCACVREPASMFVNLEKGLVKVWEMVTLTGTGQGCPSLQSSTVVALWVHCRGHGNHLMLPIPVCLCQDRVSLGCCSLCYPTGKWEGADNGMSLKASLQWKRSPGSSGGVPGDSGNVLRSFYLLVLPAFLHVLWPPTFPLISQVYPRPPCLHPCIWGRGCRRCFLQLAL